MKRKNTNKLMAYTTLAGAVLGLDNAAQAEVIETDVDPDETVSTSFAKIQIDFNDDGTPDAGLIYIDIGGQQAVGLEVLSADHSFIGQPFEANFNLFGNQFTAGSSAAVIGGNYVIGPDAGWINNSIDFDNFLFGKFPDGTSVGDWPGQSEKYLGIRFTVGSNVHYGWMRLSVPEDGVGVTLDAYAYESEPNTAITTPNTTSIDEQRLRQAAVYYAGGQLILRTAEPLTGQLSILTVNGVILNTYTLNAETEARFNVSRLSTGTYFARLSSGKAVLTRKIIIR